MLLGCAIPWWAGIYMDIPFAEISILTACPRPTRSSSCSDCYQTPPKRPSISGRSPTRTTSPKPESRSIVSLPSRSPIRTCTIFLGMARQYVEARGKKDKLKKRRGEEKSEQLSSSCGFMSFFLFSSWELLLRKKAHLNGSNPLKPISGVAW